MQTNEKMKEFFDRLAPAWVADESETSIRDEIIAMAGFAPGSVIADIGSGRGVMVPHLLKTGPQCIIENDISSGMIQLAEETWKDERIRFLCGDILQMELPALDAALIFNAFPHFVLRKELARKLASVLKPNGIIIIAHSKSREAINGIHKDGISDVLSSKLLNPLEEYENFKQYFHLIHWVDSSQLYFIKMEKL